MSTAREEPEAGVARRRVLGTTDLVLFTVSSVLIVDQLPATAAVGPSVIGWWIVMMLLFVTPYSMIAAELGSTWPSQGGAYVWIKLAFGDRWAARSAFYYWVQLSIWLPAAAILSSSMAARLVGTTLSPAAAVLAAIAVIWVTVFLSSLRTDVGKWVPNIGAILKILVMLCLGGIGVKLYLAGPPANALDWRSLLPSYGADLAFLPILVFNLFGFELIAGAGEEIENPARRLPKAMILSGLIVGVLYIFSTFGVLVVLPSHSIVLEQGIVDTLAKGFGESALGAFGVAVVGWSVVLTLLSTMVTWTIGLNRLTHEAALAGDLPRLLAKSSRRSGAPVGANIASGALGTVMLVVFLPGSDAVQQLFWNLVSLCSVVFLIPYTMMFLAFLCLRRADPGRHRPYRVPGGRLGAFIATGLAVGFVVQAMVLFVHVPGQPFNGSHTIPVLAGIAAVLVLAEGSIRLRRRLA